MLLCLLFMRKAYVKKNKPRVKAGGKKKVRSFHMWDVLVAAAMLSLLCVGAPQQTNPIFLNCTRNAQKGEKAAAAAAPKRTARKKKRKAEEGADDEAEVSCLQNIASGFRYEQMTMAKYEKPDFDEDTWYWNEEDNLMQECFFEKHEPQDDNPNLVTIKVWVIGAPSFPRTRGSPKKKQRKMVDPRKLGTRKPRPDTSKMKDMVVDISKVYYIIKSVALTSSDEEEEQ